LHDRSIVFVSRQRIARVLGVQFIDVPKMLLQCGSRLNPCLHDLYEEHPAHPRRAISYRIGLHMGFALMTMKRLLDAPSRSTNFGDNFKSWSCDDCEGDHMIVHVSNSFTSGRFLILKEHDVMRLNVPGLCLGFQINLHGTSCLVELFDGCGDTGVCITCYYPVAPHLLSKLFVPVPFGMKMARVRIGTTSQLPTLPALLSRERPVSGWPAQIALSSIAFWTGKADERWDCDLVDLANVSILSDEILRRLADELV
jgi:hypothetical protein